MGQCCANEEMITLKEFNLGLKVESSTTLQEQKVAETAAKEDLLNAKQEVEIPIKEENLEQQEQQQLKVEEIALEIEEAIKDELLDYHKFIHLYRRCLHEYKAHDIEHACDMVKELRQLQREIQDIRKISEEKFLDQVRIIEAEWKIDYADQHIQHYNPEILESMEAELKDLNYY